MKPVYVNGTGIISASALTEEELSRNISDPGKLSYPLPLEFPTKVPSSKLRRCSRYIKMACAAADQALQSADSVGKYTPERIGAVFSTGFGAVESNITFSDSVVKGDPALCSPAVFSATVPNSCLGQVCMVNGLRGEGTMLMGGDAAEYASLLLNTGKADAILCGGIEEYSKELYDSIEIAGADLSEGAAALLLTAEKGECSLCKITGFSNASFSESLFRNADAADAGLIENAVSGCDTPDIIFAAGNGSAFDESERAAFEKVFPDAKVIYPKKYFGETLGAGYIQSAVLAAKCFAENKTPEGGERVGRILVCGTDCVGNYCCMTMEAI